MIAGLSDATKRLLIVGAGALGQELKWWMRRDLQNCNVGLNKQVWFLDDGAPDQPWLLGGTGQLHFTNDSDLVLVAVGDSMDRRRLIDRFFAGDGGNCKFGSFVHNTCTPKRPPQEAPWPLGVLMMPYSSRSVGAQLGEFCIVNTYSGLGHGVTLGPFCTIASHVTLCGDVYLEDGVSVGTGAVVMPGVKIGAWAKVAPGAVVMRDVPRGATVAGNPARVVLKGAES
jgi:sugar O-acyltransferase (sialic acid O-acetyltransferase NeuD family)